MREKASKFLHHKIGTNDYSEDVEPTEEKVKEPIDRKGPAVDTVDTNMGASDKDAIKGKGSWKKEIETEEEIVEGKGKSKSKGKGKGRGKGKQQKIKKVSEGEQDDNAKEDDDALDEPGSKSAIIVDGKGEQRKTVFILI